LITFGKGYVRYSRSDRLRLFSVEVNENKLPPWKSPHYSTDFSF
jgi:hypothetical protein